MEESSAKTVDTLIAGGGIAGLLLARELRARHRRVMVVDDIAAKGAWSAAVGLLNPVRGQRYTIAWRAREAFAAAREVYGSLALSENQPWIARDLPIRRYFKNDSERELLRARRDAIGASGFWIHEIASPRRGIEIHGGAIVDAAAAVTALRAELQQAGAWSAGRAREEELAFDGRNVAWRNIVARRLVLAGGAGDIGHPWLGGLALRAVKGESLVARIPGLPAAFALAGALHLAPRPDGAWICGGTKSPDCNDTQITTAARDELSAFLNEAVGTRWEIIARMAGVRAASPDRLPIAGELPDRRGVFVLNGFGSQGVAYGPWIARLLAARMTTGAEMPREIAIGRFYTRDQVTGDRNPI